MFNLARLPQGLPTANARIREPYRLRYSGRPLFRMLLRTRVNHRGREIGKIPANRRTCPAVSKNASGFSDLEANSVKAPVAQVKS